MKHILSKNLSRFKAKNLNESSEDRQDYYKEIIKNNNWNSYESAHVWLQDQGLSDRMIDAILDSIFPKDQEDLYEIFFVTAYQPNLEDAEGWYSLGKDSEDAWKNLYSYFKNETTRGKNMMVFFKVEIKKSKKNPADVKPYTRFQG